MSPEDKKGLSRMQQYVVHLRYRLIHYELERIDPPENLLNELKLAERLVQIDLKYKKIFEDDYGTKL
jgi:uncharacterized protein with ACT and thioredoxin-like domain